MIRMVSGSELSCWYIGKISFYDYTRGRREYLCNNIISVTFDIVFCRKKLIVKNNRRNQKLSPNTYVSNLLRLSL